MALTKVTTPVLGFTGESVGVSFRDGVGHTDNPAALAYFRSQGYGVEEAGAPADADPAPRKSASKADWAAYAVAHGMTAEEAETLTRDQLVERFTTKEEQP